MRILIIKLSAIGDVVHSLAFLHAIKMTYPHAHVSWIVSEKSYSLLEGHEYIDKLYLFKRTTPGLSLMNLGSWYHYLLGFMRLINDIRRAEFDYVVDLQGLLKSSVFVLFSRSREKVGFKNARELGHLPLTKKIEVPTLDMHAVDRYLLVARHLGMVDGDVRFPVTTTKEDEARLTSLLKKFGLDGGELVGIIPGAGWRSKLWTVEGFSGLVKAFIRNGLNCIIVGANTDRWLSNQILMHINGKSGCYDFTGLTDLRMLYLLFKRMRLVISTDTGPMHLADASGVPVISLFGPTAPWRTGPYNNLGNVIRLGLPCSPCFRRICKDPVCMKEISVDMVLDKANMLLSG